MYSKNLAVVFSMLIFSGCSWVRDTPQSKTISTEKMNLNCLNTLPEKLTKLFEGKLTAGMEAENASIWSCLDTTLSSFLIYTRGRNGDRYETTELKNFSNRYLPKEQQVSSDFMSGIFKMKASIVGGSNNHITKKEVEAFRQVIKKFGNAVIPLAPHIHTLLNHKNSNDPLVRISASLALENFVSDLSIILSGSSNNLAWSDFYQFLNELNKFLILTPKRSTSDSVSNVLSLICEQFDLFKSLKLLLVGGSDTVIEKNQWVNILKDIAKGYTALLFAADSADLLERLDIITTSTEADRLKATEQITATLAKLIHADDLHNRAGIQQLADHWAKVLIANYAFFPKSGGALEVKIFLESQNLRSLFAKGIKHFEKLNTQNDIFSDMAAEQISGLVDVGTDILVEINNKAGGSERAPVATNIQLLKEKVAILKPFFTEPNEADLALDAVQMILTARPLFSKRVGDFFYITEWNPLLQKGLGFYKTLKKQNGRPWTTESISEIANTLLDTNVGQAISKESIDNAYPALTRILNRLKIDPSIITTIQKYTNAAFEGKSILYGNSPTSISLAELQQIQVLIRTYADTSRTLSDRFQQLAIDLSVVGIHEFKIKSFIDWANANLKKPIPLDDYHLTAESLGSIKKLLMGGDALTLSNSDLKSICLLISEFALQFPNLEISGMNDAGLNYKMFDTISRALTALSVFHSRGIGRTRPEYEGVDLNALVDFSANYQAELGYSIRKANINRLVRGLYNRGFEPNKLPIPDVLTGSLSSKNLALLAERFNRAAVLYKALETLTSTGTLSTAERYQLNTPTQLLQSRLELLSESDQAFFKKLLKSFPPQMDGTSRMILYPKLGSTLDSYSYYDLAFKTLLITFAEWLTPGYEIESPIQIPILNYVTNSDRMKWTINDLAGFLDDTSGILYDLGISFATLPSKVMAGRQMTASNLFMATSTGNDDMNFNEAVEYINVNAGTKAVFDILWSDLKSLCTNIGTNEKPLYTASCVEKNIFDLNNIDKWFSTALPQWVQRIRHLKSDELKSFQEAFLKSVRTGIDRKKSWDLFDIQTSIAIPHYIESAYLKFDKNLNGQLEFKEAMKAFPIFCNEIKKASNLPGSCDPDYAPLQVEALYGHFLFYEAAPDASGSIWHKIKVGIHWSNWQRFWKRLDRSDATRDVQGPFLKRDGLIQILSNLAETSTASASFAPKLNHGVQLESR